MASTFTVSANQNEMLDALVWRHLGAASPVLEQVMALNPALANYEFLPEGTIVILPKKPETTTPTREIINLWD